MAGSTKRPGIGMFGWVLVLLAIAVAVAALAFAAVVLVPAALVMAVLVVAKPQGAGARIRSWRVWRRLPGMAVASRGAAGFAALLLLYVAAIPSASLGIVLAGAHGGGGGTTTAQSTTQATAEPTTEPSAPPATITTSTPQPTDTPTAPPAPTSTPTAAPTPPPTPVPTPRPTPAPPPPAPVANTCGAPSNPWGYTFCAGATINSPPSSFCNYFDCIASFWNGTGYVEQCVDLTFSKSGGHSGSCSHHGGNKRPLFQR
jgi:hypothetical protein